MNKPASDVAFSPAVKAMQQQKGSRAAYARMEQNGGFEREIGPDLAAFIAAQRSFFLASASADGQPYVQHRGGPPGFLRVVDPRTLAMRELKGNRQYISQGNLSENPRVMLFLIDYAQRRRVKIWGTAEVVDDELVVHVSAWDVNCPQHIPQRFEAEDVRAVLEAKERRIAELEAELVNLRRERPEGGRQE